MEDISIIGVSRGSEYSPNHVDNDAAIFNKVVEELRKLGCRVETYTEKEFVAIEVKNAAKLTKEDFSGLKAFREDYPEARAVLLYRGKEQYLVGDVLVMPVDTFLVNMVPNAPLPDKGCRR